MSMREIKFRGKDTFKPYCLPAKWWYGGIMQDGEDAWLCVKTEDKGIISVKVEPDTVGQYTELLDRNGKEIFEGDVMEYKNNIGVVTYYNGRGQFQLKVKGQPPITLHNMKGTILGNIHDNPILINK